MKKEPYLEEDLGVKSYDYLDNQVDENNIIIPLPSSPKEKFSARIYFFIALLILVPILLYLFNN